MMNRKHLVWPLLALALTLTGPAPAAGQETLKPSEGDRCAVCGMYVAPYPEWIAAVGFSDGSRYFFDGPKDMFSFLFSLERYRAAEEQASIETVQVTEYYTTRPVPAAEVFFVGGSDVLGPMGQELVPVAGDEALKTFLQDHGGDRVMRYEGSELRKVESPQ